MDTYQDQIVVILGAHIHSGEIRVPSSHLYPNLKKSVMVSPAVSPIYSNNPGYSVMDVSYANAVEKVDWRFLQLQEYMLFRYKRYYTMDPESFFALKLNDP